MLLVKPGWRVVISKSHHALAVPLGSILPMEQSWNIGQGFPCILEWGLVSWPFHRGTDNQPDFMLHHVTWSTCDPWEPSGNTL